MSKRKTSIHRVAHSHDLSANYRDLLADIKGRIRAAQVRAALSVNRELIQLYWDIGRAIVVQQQTKGWGAKIVDQLAADLHRAFPDLRGFSRANLMYMRAFAEAHADASIVQQVVGQIPWGHNIALIEKLKDPAQRLWYAQQTIANGWSRSMLEHWIESDLHARQGRAVTNFKATLPAAQSDLAQQVVKDPYNFDFLTLHAQARERQLEEALTDQITRFLLELGAGFAFVGRQVHLEVDSQDFYLDLLFYHLDLRCFVVVDLKARRFEPEFAGKMNFYLSAVDDRMRKTGDAASIGLILCKTSSKVIAEYALRHLERPVGVARYVTKLTEKLPGALADKLPTIPEIEAGLAGSAPAAAPTKRRKKGKARWGVSSEIVWRSLVSSPPLDDVCESASVMTSKPAEARLGTKAGAEIEGGAASDHLKVVANAGRLKPALGRALPK